MSVWMLPMKAVAYIGGIQQESALVFWAEPLSFLIFILWKENKTSIPFSTFHYHSNNNSRDAVAPVYLYLCEHKAPRANWRSGQCMSAGLVTGDWSVSDGDRWGRSWGFSSRFWHDTPLSYRLPLYFLSAISKTGGGQSNAHASHTRRWYLHSIDCRFGRTTGLLAGMICGGRITLCSLSDCQ